MSISSGPAWEAWRAGAAAAPLAVVASAWIGAGSAFFPSSSRMSAPSPRPRAFLGIGNHLPGELCVTLGPLAMNIVENDGLSKAGCFGEANVARDQALEDLRSEEATEVRGDLPRKGRSFIIHRQENAFDFESWIQNYPNSHKSIPVFGYDFVRPVFALYG